MHSIHTAAQHELQLLHITDVSLATLQELLTHKLALRIVSGGLKPLGSEHTAHSVREWQWQRAGDSPWEPFLITDGHVQRLQGFGMC